MTTVGSLSVVEMGEVRMGINVVMKACGEVSSLKKRARQTLSSCHLLSCKGQP